jgi:hypothetical protein
LQQSKTTKINLFELKVEIILEQRQVAFLSPSKICAPLKIQIFANFAG